MIERRSKRGKVFYGCLKYPDCDFVRLEQARSGAVSAMRCAIPAGEIDEAGGTGPLLQRRGL